MLFINSSIVLDPVINATLEWPVFLWNNLLTFTGIVASDEDPNYPATNLWNPQTSSLWKSGTADAVILEFAVESTEPIDAIGFARHNFGSCQAEITINGLTADDGAVYTEIANFTAADDHVFMAIVEQDFYISIQVIITPSNDVEPEAGYASVGTLLRMSTGIPPGHIPINDSLDTTTLTGIAENGDFLDDVITSERLSTSIKFQYVNGDWYRANMRAMVQSRKPMFFGWAPMLYPDEMGLVKFTGSPKPVINATTGEIDIELAVVGLAY